MAATATTSPSVSRALILDVAVRLFGQQGFSGTSMRDIAKSVGVLAGSLYAHIDSKETLLVEIVDVGITSFLEAVEPIALSKGPPEQRMREIIRAHVEVVAQNPERSLVVFHQWRFLGEANLNAAIEKRRRYARAFERVIKDGIAAGIFDQHINVRIAAFTVLGALNWTPEWYAPDGRSTPSELGDLMADSLVRGLSARP